MSTAKIGDVRVVGVYNRYVKGVWDGGPAVVCGAGAQRAQWWEIQLFTAEGWKDEGSREYDTREYANHNAARLMAVPRAERADFDLTENDDFFLFV